MGKRPQRLRQLLTAALVSLPGIAWAQDEGGLRLPQFAPATKDEIPTPAPRPQVREDEPPEIIPAFTSSAAFSADVRRLVGQARYEMAQCPPAQEYEIGENRQIRVTLGRTVVGSLAAHPEVADALLDRAAHEVWERCPHPFQLLEGGYHRDIDRVEIANPDGSLLLTARLGDFQEHGDTPFAQGTHGYAWHNVLDEERVREQQEAYLRSQPKVGNPVVDAQHQLEFIKSIFAMIWLIIKLIILGLLGWWLWTKRLAIAEWFYSLSPHPATNMVDAAITCGEPIDGALYVAIHRPRFSNRAQNAARTRQAQELIGRLRSHEEALRRATRREVERHRQHVERETEFMRMHEGLLRAGVDHEVAVVQLDEARRRKQWAKK